MEGIHEAPRSAAGSYRAETPIQYLKGVGPKLGAILAEKGIHTVGELLAIFPRAYEDRKSAKKIRDLIEDEPAVVSVEVARVHQRRLRGGRRLLEWACCDETGVLTCVFFHFTSGFHLAVKPGTHLSLVGKPSLRGGKLQMTHPQFRIIAEDETAGDVSILPVYPEPQPLSQNKWRSLVNEALAGYVFESDVLKRLLTTPGYPELEKSYRFLHAPPESADIARLQERQDPHFLRFVFEELFLYELGLLLRHRQTRREHARVISPKSKRTERLKASLPFHLTQDQTNVINEISSWMARGERVNALIQGDVGSGKTLVALFLALAVVDAGFQVALMAPTELLAEQHFRTLKKLCKDLDVEIDLVTGSLSGAQKKIVQENLSTGRTHVAVGTHALIQEGVRLPNLALIVVDEQHRFGVQQRLRLSQKGSLVHQIHMTATPIPRTLALTLFGDMDVLSIRQKPAGRKPVRTKWVGQERRMGVYDFLDQECAKGRQAYVVFPLIEESETLDLKNATKEFEALKAKYPLRKMELLHGRLPVEERERVMRAFVEGKVDVLVSTTVIEVGVDVPNATIMVVENAERFGLSQLHQLRGRVGRGDAESWCVLISGPALSAEGQMRLQVMEGSTDGFVISEKDLEIRGPGEFIGEKQSGLPEFRCADILKHQDVLTRAREYAADLLDSGSAELLQNLENLVHARFGARLKLLDA